MSRKILLACATSVDTTATVEMARDYGGGCQQRWGSEGQGPAAKDSLFELRTLLSRAARNHDGRASRKQHSRFLAADIARRSRRGSLLRQIG